MAEGGDDRMNARCLTLTPGAQLVYDGDLVEVIELDGARVVVRNARTAGFATVKLGRLAAGARPADAPAARDEPSPPGVAWTGLTDAQRAAAGDRAAHVRSSSEPTRLAILLTLQEGERRITDLAAELGGSPTSISSHLTSLKESGLITGRPQGRSV
jgi:Bacterial regulatory protein, arsR family